MSDNNKISSTLRLLARNADKGDLRAIYQLFLNFLHGNYSEPNKKSSERYLTQLIEKIDGKKLILDEMILNDFRGINNLKIQFDTRLTVLVGNNGYGKSTVLDALAMTLSWLKSNILREDRPGLSIKESDINNNKIVQYASITSKFSLNKTPFTIMLSKAKEGSPEKRNNELIEIKSLASIYRHVSELSSSINLPLLAYYSVSRSTEGGGIDSKKINQTNKNEWSKFDAYEDVFTDRHDFGEFFKWFIFINNIAQQNSKSEIKNKINKLVAEINGAELVLKQIQSVQDIQLEYLKPIQEEINFKTLQIKNLNIEYYKNDDKTASKLIESIILSFEKFLPELKNIRIQYDKNSVKLLVEKNGLQIDAQQLSQGEKSLLTLVGDLTRRLVILNSSRENPLEGYGIVLIDEIDLHLHPLWQQTIVGNLLSTFPNIQLIISTHSPQVLSTVAAKSIKILSAKYNKTTDQDEMSIHPPEFQTKGVKSTDVLSEVMNTDPLPPIIEADWIEEYIELIETGNSNSSKAILLKDKIVSHYGTEHPIVKKCENIILLQKMKIELAKRRLSNKGDV
ncbi:AAA family ATPase [Yersinia enterocolitica]|nr:DUF2813 domain-containing protein [Yersinia enterocolitica]HEN3286902.1 AAA family ATPase [Yersinia enterocolitica]